MYIIYEVIYMLGLWFHRPLVLFKICNYFLVDASGGCVDAQHLRVSY